MIKMILISCGCCLVLVSARAQFEKGQKVAGGNIGFSTGNNEHIDNSTYTSNYSHVSLNPTIASFSKPNQLRGVGLSYRYSYGKSKNSFNNDFSRTWSHSMGIHVFSQRFLPITKNLFFTITATGGLLYSKGKLTNTSNNIDNESRSKGYGIDIGIAPGVTYKLSSRLLFDAYLSNLINISFNHNQTKSKSPSGTNLKSNQNTFSLASSLSNTVLGNIGIGFRWLLKK